MIGGMDQEEPMDQGMPEERPPVPPEEPTPGSPEATPTLPIFGWEPSRAPGTALGSPPPRRRVARVVVASVLAALVLLASGIGIGWVITRNGPTPGTGTPIATAPAGPAQAGQADRAIDQAAVTAKLDPAVVNINTVIDSDPFDSLPARGRGAGTGMVITSDGLVLTNNHVIEGATRIEVSVAGSSTYVAQFVGADPKDDIAVLRIPGVSGLSTVTLGDSSRLRVGQQVLAIGNALGRGGSPTVAQGAISALSRTINIDDGRGGVEHLSGLIQTDAAIQPGDSGGPLVNAAAQVVGMITAGSRSGPFDSGSRVGFAIPSSAAVSVVNEIRAGRATSNVIIGQPGYLGIEVQELNASNSPGLNVSSGVLVVNANSGTPAARAGMSQGSVITAIDGQRVSSIDELGTALHRLKPGERVRVTWVDRSGTHTASIRLVNGPAV
jgi:S1-C subfamily serine protease